MPIAAVGLTTGDYANTLRKLPACLDRFERLGVDSVELSLGMFDVVAGARVLPHRMAELKRICADRPFRYTVHGPIASSFGDEQHLALQMDVCRAALDVSGELGATAQVHHAAALPLDSAAERERLLAIEREALAQIAPFAADRRVNLCVENIFGGAKTWFLSPSELAEQIQAVGHPNIRATIDFSHAAINADVRGYDLMPELADLAQVAGHLHLHDSFGRPATFRAHTYGEGIMFGLGDLHMPLGWGALDWDAIAKLPYPHDVVATLELPSRFEDELEASVERCRQLMAISQEG